MIASRCLPALSFAALFALSPPAAFADVTIKKEADLVRVEIDGQLFTEYHFTGARRPYLYPVIGPGGVGMTRNWPMKDDVPGEEKDHPHHMGLWYGHRHVNGAGFWENTAKPGTKLGQIVHDGFEKAEGGKQAGVIKAKNKWVLDDSGEVLCTDVRTITARKTAGGRILDFDITITAGSQDVVFGDDKDGAMAIRVAESMRVERPKPKAEKPAPKKEGEAPKAAPAEKPAAPPVPKGEGHILVSNGKRDAEAWGTRGEWCAYYGPVEGRTLGVAIFDHPKNPRHPTWWHVRTYGLFAANPFGQAQFEKLPNKTAGEFKIEAGKSATFRYRFFFYEGEPEKAGVASQYQTYISAK